MLKINGKTFMNLQEAVQWLLDNNALPFQCSANYVANTEIGLGTIVNPSPAKVRIGSLIFFADSKVSTVIGLTENGFIVSDQYNDLVDDVVYVSNVALDASGHLIVTLSNGNTIDAGLIKQVTNFSINASQHLIVNYNDGTSTDLGAIFAGNISISGNITATGTIQGGTVLELMSGYTFDQGVVDSSVTLAYAGVVKTGNKLTLALAGSVQNATSGGKTLGAFYIPVSVWNKLYPLVSNYLASQELYFIDNFSNVGTNKPALTAKVGTSGIRIYAYDLDSLTPNTPYYFRFEITFLLSENMAS